MVKGNFESGTHTRTHIFSPFKYNVHICSALYNMYSVWHDHFTHNTVNDIRVKSHNWPLSLYLVIILLCTNFLNTHVCMLTVSKKTEFILCFSFDLMVLFCLAETNDGVTIIYTQINLAVRSVGRLVWAKAVCD